MKKNLPKRLIGKGYFHLEEVIQRKNEKLISKNLHRV